MSIALCSSLKTGEMQQLAAPQSRMTPLKTFNSTKEIEEEIVQINETFRIRQVHLFKCLFECVSSMPAALIRLIIEYDVPLKLALGTFAPHPLKLVPKTLYGIEINDNSSLILMEWKTSRKTPKNIRIQGAAFYGIKGDFFAIIQERAPKTIVADKEPVKVTTWGTDPDLRPDESNLLIDHLTVDNRRQYDIVLPYEGSFYKIYQIHNPAEAAKFEKVTLVYDSRKPI